MPVTSYDTLDGQIRGQSSAGVRTDYLTDALGSVTATLDQSQAVQATYRYKPYGQRLAKTGSGVDPRFLWTGDTGSRVTGLSGAEQYNVRRHYGVNGGRWLSADPLWPVEMAYAYCSCSPVLAVDPGGLSPKITRIKKNLVIPKCGQIGSVDWDFKVAGKVTGWLVQHIVRKRNEVMCSGAPISDGLPPDCLNYYEAWPVVAGIIYLPTDAGWKPITSPGFGTPRPSADFWSDSARDCGSGTASIQGSLMFVPDKNPTSRGPQGLKQDSNTCAKALFAAPTFNGFVAQPGTSAQFSLNWGCCAGEKYQCPPPGSVCSSSCRDEGPCRGPYLTVFP
jgi:RHS repeat-associated protein